MGDVTFAIRWEIQAKAPYNVKEHQLIWAQITKNNKQKYKEVFGKP